MALLCAALLLWFNRLIFTRLISPAQQGTVPVFAVIPAVGDGDGLEQTLRHLHWLQGEKLSQFRPELTVAQLRQALVEAFGRVYGLPVHPLRTDQLDAQALARGRARFADPAWVYGDSRPLAVSREARFTWGLLRLDYSQAEGSITQAALWSDGLEADFLSQVPGALQGCPRQPAAVRARLMALKGAERTLVEDILTLLMEEA